MKKKHFCIIAVLLGCNFFGQVSYIGFDTTICGHPVNYSYSYNNWTYGSGSYCHVGYDISRSGQTVSGQSDYCWQSYPQCKDLIFVNDSIGFKYVNWGHGSGLFRSANYGASWSPLYQYSPETYFKAFPLNSTTAYLVTVTSLNSKVALSVRRCVAGQQAVSIVLDTAINQDLYIIDSTISTTLCQIKSLTLAIKNNPDTIYYHFNFSNEVSGENEISKESENLIVFPNPAQEFFHLSKRKYSVDEIIITDIEGRLVKKFGSTDVAGNNYSISSLNNGVYVVRITATEGYSELKLVVNR